MDISKRLLDFLDDQKTLPFLFVGSGISRRYLGLESWEDLLIRFSENLPRSYSYYRGKSNENLPELASLMASDFFDVWFEEDKYQESRERFEEVIINDSSPLKVEISNYIQDAEVIGDLSEELQEEIELFQQSNVDGIITTNWDTFLEENFSEFERYIGQEEILFNNHQSVAEIFKIHGCSTNPNSLVLTKEDYDKYEEKNAYLASKLLTIFVDHPIIFLGYSLNDPNIQNILSKVFNCLDEEKIKTISERLIFVEWDRNDEGDYYEITPHAIASHRVSLRTIRTNDFRNIYEPLSKIERRYPAKVLRNLKEKIYDLVLTNDPKNKISVVDIENVDNYDEVEVVMGLGIKSQLSDIGYKSIQINDVIDDVINDQNNWDSKSIINDTLPQLSGARSYLPIFKYINHAGFIDDEGDIQFDKIPAKIHKYAEINQDYFISIQYWRDRKDQLNNNFESLEELINSETVEHCLYIIPLLDLEKIDLDLLHEFIINNAELIESTNNMHKTYFIALVHYYDYLKYYVNA